MERAPLAGRTILVTRAREQAAALAESLEALGAKVLHLPVIAFADPEDWGPLDAALGEIASFDWIIFTSANGVERFFARLESRGMTVERLAGARVAAIGPATGAALEGRGRRPDVVPKVFRAEELAAALPLADLAGRKVLVARAQKAREVLPETLAEAGARVTVAPCYRTVAPETDAEGISRLLEEGRIDLVTFTSSSTVSNFVACFPEGRAARLLERAAVACIGPVTAATAREMGIDPDVVAESFTIQALVDAVVRKLAAPAP